MAKKQVPTRVAAKAFVNGLNREATAKKLKSKTKLYRYRVAVEGYAWVDLVAKNETEATKFLTQKVLGKDPNHIACRETPDFGEARGVDDVQVMEIRAVDIMEGPREVARD
jgi:hypothetical protein